MRYCGLQMHRASRSILDAVPDKADTIHWSCLSTLLASSYESGILLTFQTGSKFDFGHLVPGSCGVAKGVSDALAQAAREFSAV